ncbi:MAG TPA: GNAT family N-acetyltransferase [Bryobacteraceae bacterium]|nr:GNAT family N-acetyltransferase [Bryobacteraceae bacterium]
MAAVANPMGQNAGQREIVDLRRIAVRDLEPLLADEVAEWRRELAWDFEPSAALVRRYAGSGSLGGAALVVNGQVAGYGYAVLEEPRGIIGDLYLRPHMREAGAEAELFRSLLDALAATPRVSRMESQLMLVRGQTAELIRSTGRPVRTFARRLMVRDDACPLAPSAALPEGRFRFDPWEDSFLHLAGAIIATSYKGQTDSEINSQYRSPSGARRFLSNIVEFPGCGLFHAPGSFVVFDRQSGDAVGMVLASFVAEEAGHISQLCVAPGLRGAGLGRELLRRSDEVLRGNGARLVSLTVTESNAGAIALYERSGFRTVRNFFAYTWEA